MINAEMSADADHDVVAGLRNELRYGALAGNAHRLDLVDEFVRRRCRSEDLAVLDRDPQACPVIEVWEASFRVDARPESQAHLGTVPMPCQTTPGPKGAEHELPPRYKA